MVISGDFKSEPALRAIEKVRTKRTGHGPRRSKSPLDRIGPNDGGHTP